MRAYPKKGFSLRPGQRRDAEEGVRHRLTRWQRLAVEDLFRFLIVFGLQAAAIYAVAASGLVVTYTTSGIFNFAHGATGMMAAFTYWELSAEPRAGPAGSRSSSCCSSWRPLLGWLLDRLIMRRLADASTITTIVVTIGLLVAFVSLAGIIWPQGTSTRVLPEFFRARPCRSSASTSRYHAFVVLGAAVARRHRAAAPAVRHPHRRRDAGRGRQPRARRAQRGRPEPGLERRLGARLDARRAGRHADRADPPAVHPSPSPCWSSRPTRPRWSGGCGACRSPSSAR